MGPADFGPCGAAVAFLDRAGTNKPWIIRRYRHGAGDPIRPAVAGGLRRRQCRSARNAPAGGGSSSWGRRSNVLDLFAIAQTAPGPNFLISTLIGWTAAGVAGALVATLAMAGPSRLMPASVGLVLTGGWLLARAADVNAKLALVTAAIVVATYSTRLNPLCWLAAAAALGWSGLLGG